MYSLFPSGIAFTGRLPKSYDNDKLHISLMPMDNGKTLLTLFAGFPKVPEELQDVAFQIFDDHGVVGVGTTDQRGQCWLEGISEKQNYFLELHIPELKT